MTQRAPHSVQTMVAMGRRYRRQTQQDLADALTVETGQEWSRGQVGHIESGRRKLTVDELQVIARIQRLPVSWYFDEPTKGGLQTVDYGRTSLRPKDNRPVNRSPLRAAA